MPYYFCQGQLLDGKRVRRLYRGLRILRSLNKAARRRGGAWEEYSLTAYNALAVTEPGLTWRGAHAHAAIEITGEGLITPSRRVIVVRNDPIPAVTYGIG